MAFCNYNGHEYNLCGKTLNLVTYEFEGVTGNVDPITGILHGAGVAENVIRDMQSVLGFRVSVKILRGKDPSTPDYFQDGIGTYLSSGLGDIGVGYFYVVPPRVLVATPLLQIFTDRLVALFVQPDSSVVRNIYGDPFTTVVYIVWFSLLFMTATTILILKVRSDSTWKKLIACSIFLTISIMSQADSSLHLLTSSGLRGLILCMTQLSTYLHGIYSAKIISTLTNHPVPIQSLNELIRIGYTFHAQPYGESYIFNDSRFIGLDVKRKRFDEGGMASVAAIFLEKHVHVDVGLESEGGVLWHSIFKKLYGSGFEDKVCTKVYSIPIQKSNFGMACSFFVANGSAMRGGLNWSILRIMETGLMHKYANYHTVDRMRCPLREISRYQENLGLKDVSIAFIFYIAIAVCSLVFMMLECFTISSEAKVVYN